MRISVYVVHDCCLRVCFAGALWSGYGDLSFLYHCRFGFSHWELETHRTLVFLSVICREPKRRSCFPLFIYSKAVSFLRSHDIVRIASCRSVYHLHSGVHSVRNVVPLLSPWNTEWKRRLKLCVFPSFVNHLRISRGHLGRLDLNCP